MRGVKQQVTPLSLPRLDFIGAIVEAFCRNYYVYETSEVSTSTRGIRGLEALFYPNGFNIGKRSNAVMGKLAAVATDLNATKGQARI